MEWKRKESAPPPPPPKKKKKKKKKQICLHKINDMGSPSKLKKCKIKPDMG